jgi:osmotically-inducible protein OsmY
MVGAAAMLSPSRIGNDERLAHTVECAVRAAGVRVINRLTIVAREGSVTLQGRARTFYEKQLVLHAARRVPGVRQIVDELDVLPTFE